MEQDNQMPRAACNIYARLLTRADPTRGYPIYIPGPNEVLTPEDQAAGTRIGDLGFFVDGAFCSIFNSCLPASHSFHQRHGVPEGFKPVELQVSEEHHDDVAVVHGADPRGHTMSKTRTTASVFESATLILPDGADKWDVSVNGREQLEAQAKESAMSWYQHVNGHLGCMKSNGSLFVMTGFHKTSAYNITTVMHRQGGIGRFYRWQSTSSPIHRAARMDKQNQTIFLRGFRVTVRQGLMSLLLKPVKLTPVPSTRVTLIQAAPTPEGQQSTSQHRHDDQRETGDWQMSDATRAGIERMSAGLPIEHRDTFLQAMSPENLGMSPPPQ